MKIEEQIKKALEAPEVIEETKVYSRRYYLDSEGIIENIESVREDMEYFVDEYIPEKFPARTLEFLLPSNCDEDSHETYLNREDVDIPFCFTYKVRQPNNPPVNPTDKVGVDIYYKVKVRASL